MARRTWMGTIAIAILMVVMFAAAGRRGSTLQSRHAEPATSVPSGDVLVVPDGKVFHRPGCTYLHGAPQWLPGREAVRLGYAPCVRCESKRLGG